MRTERTDLLLVGAAILLVTVACSVLLHVGYERGRREEEARMRLEQALSNGLPRTPQVR